MSVPDAIFFDLPLAADALGVWTMTAANGARRDFHSRIEALEFALHEARDSLHYAQGTIRIEGADLRWRSFDCELRALVDGKPPVGDGRVSK